METTSAHPPLSAGAKEHTPPPGVTEQQVAAPAPRPKRPTRRRLAAIAAGALLAVIATAAVAAPAAAQDNQNDTTARIVARKINDGRIEFGLQVSQGTGSWSEPQLPARRFFPANAQEGRWLTSSPLTLTSRATQTQTSRLSVGGAHWCWLKSDGTIRCSGDNDLGQADAPSGQFTAVSAGFSHSCGIRTNGTITCWGSNWFGQTDAPDGQFTAVGTGLLSCGLRTDGTITCWGEDETGNTPELDGRFIAVSGGEDFTCGLRSDDTVECAYHLLTQH